MTLQSDQAKWDALAEMLGAQVNQAEGSPPPPQSETKIVPRVQLELPPSPRKQADWDSLASDLGAKDAEVEHRPEPPRVPSTEAPSHFGEQSDHEIPGFGSDPSPSCSSPVFLDSEEKVLDVDEGDDVPEDALNDSAGEGSIDDVTVEDRDQEPKVERRPSRRRRRRGQRQSSDAVAERPERTETVPEATEQELADRSDHAAPQEPSERRSPGGGSKRAGHKSVPSWAEAISLMIDGNLSNRSSRRRAGANGGRPRGRRGGRRS